MVGAFKAFEGPQTGSGQRVGPFERVPPRHSHRVALKVSVQAPALCAPPPASCVPPRGTLRPLISTRNYYRGTSLKRNTHPPRITIGP